MEFHLWDDMPNMIDGPAVRGRTFIRSTRYISAVLANEGKR
jgi:hypothetical protein